MPGSSACDGRSGRRPRAQRPGLSEFSGFLLVFRGLGFRGLGFRVKGLGVSGFGVKVLGVLVVGFPFSV